MTKHQLVARNGKVIFESARKMDTIFRHQSFKRRQGVTYREVQA